MAVTVTPPPMPLETFLVKAALLGTRDRRPPDRHGLKHVPNSLPIESIGRHDRAGGRNDFHHQNSPQRTPPHGYVRSLIPCYTISGLTIHIKITNN